MAERLQLPETQVRLLLNSQATHAGLLEGLDWLSQSAGMDDDVIIYFNGHGTMLSDQDPSSRHGMAEVFCLWTPEEPFSDLHAVASGQWMIDHEFARATSRIKARAKILVVDACHASAAERALFYPGEAHDYNDPYLILIAATTAKQVSFFDPVRGKALFTANLIQAIERGALTLRDAFDEAKVKTMDQAPRQCQRLGMHPCLGQTPTRVDPHDLAAQIRFLR